MKKFVVLIIGILIFLVIFAVCSVLNKRPKKESKTTDKKAKAVKTKSQEIKTDPHKNKKSKHLDQNLTKSNNTNNSEKILNDTPQPNDSSKEVKDVKLDEKDVSDILNSLTNSKDDNISKALEDDFNDFQNYLKERLYRPNVAEKPAEQEFSLPDIEQYLSNDNYKSEYDNMLQDEYYSFNAQNKKKPLKQRINELPDDIKLLLFSDFFKRKF